MNAKSVGYDNDFYAWVMHNVQLIKEGRFTEIDRVHVAEELEDMGKGYRRELINRFAVLLTHLLKWDYQSSMRTKSWKLTIKHQRLEIFDLFKESPSLQYEVESYLSNAYKKAVIFAAREMGVDEDIFPTYCPYQMQQCLDHDFLPE
jgi:hypothetical protein